MTSAILDRRRVYTSPLQVSNYRLTAALSAAVFIGRSLFSILSFILVMTLGIRVLAQQPADYFRPVIPILENSAGIILIVAGLVMLFVLGQGILTLPAGLILMEFAGKYRCER
jgi:hypothetical protein